VGPKKKAFTVYEKVITKASGFFEEELDREFKMSRERTVSLPNDTPEVFSVYKHWLYSHAIFSQMTEAQNKKQSWKEFTLLSDTYMFGEKIQDSDFKDAVLDSLIEKAMEEVQYPSHILPAIYEGTQDGSPLRRFMVDFFAWHGYGGLLTGKNLNGDFGNPELRGDLLRALLAVRDENPSLSWTEMMKYAPYVAGTCTYHDHNASETPCYKTKYKI